ncbi:hypothetical protein MKX03_000490, partial [Papaver bracteatum]
MKIDLLCYLFDNLDFAIVSQGQSLTSLIEIDFLCNTFKDLNLDDGNHSRVKAIEFVVLEESTYCQALVTGKILSSLSRGFNSSQENDTQAWFIFSGKSLSVISFRDVYVDGEEVSDDLNLNLSNEIDGIPQT